MVAAVLRRIDECAALGPDGDSYGGEPLSPVARAEASRWVEIVADLCGARVGAAARPASVAPLADGGVQIEWRGPGDVLALEVGPAGELGSLCLAAAAGGQRAEEADDAAWSDVLRALQRALGA